MVACPERFLMMPHSSSPSPQLAVQLAALRLSAHRRTEQHRDPWWVVVWRGEATGDVGAKLRVEWRMEVAPAIPPWPTPEHGAIGSVHDFVLTT